MLIFAGLTIVSCKKHAGDAPGTHLLGFLSAPFVKINQTVIIYDSTVIRDSIDFVKPPTSRLYEWKITPETNAAVWSGNYLNGLGSLAFTRSGNYQVMANIYDSATKKFLARTNTVVVRVGTDTLFPSYPIYADDVLQLSPRFYTSSTNGGPRIVGLLLVCSTTRSYEYWDPYVSFDYTSSTGNNSYSFVFPDSLRLTSYPFAPGYNNDTSRVQQGMDLPGFTSNMTVGLHVTWLNKVYSGTLTLGGSTYSINWDNSGAVKFTN